ncbi:MAG: hypothetical protein V2J25_13275 [Desulfatiglans sp.]|jgi:hypothetical protein|nr:hypothetical protein [Desulfatiglans sp.]
MAGADRFTFNTSTTDNIVDYRNASYQTETGLDGRFGAGQVNIYNGYHIIAGGELNSDRDDPSGPGEIGWQGFDFDPFFGVMGDLGYSFILLHLAGNPMRIGSLPCMGYQNPWRYLLEFRQFSNTVRLESVSLRCDRSARSSNDDRINGGYGKYREPVGCLAERQELSNESHGSGRPRGLNRSTKPLPKWTA